jgi:hypothetical protein
MQVRVRHLSSHTTTSNSNNNKSCISNAKSISLPCILSRVSFGRSDGIDLNERKREYHIQFYSAYLSNRNKYINHSPSACKSVKGLKSRS